MIYVPLFYEAVFDQPPRTIEREELGRKKKKKKNHHHPFCSTETLQI